MEIISLYIHRFADVLSVAFVWRGPRVLLLYFHGIPVFVSLLRIHDCNEISVHKLDKCLRHQVLMMSHTLSWKDANLHVLMLRNSQLIVSLLLLFPNSMGGLGTITSRSWCVTSFYFKFTCLYNWWMIRFADSTRQRYVAEEIEKLGKNNIAADIFAFHDLSVATNNFDAGNLVGEGGFGRVYKGCIEGRKEVLLSQSNTFFVFNVLNPEELLIKSAWNVFFIGCGSEAAWSEWVPRKQRVSRGSDDVEPSSPSESCESCGILLRGRSKNSRVRLHAQWFPGGSPSKYAILLSNLSQYLKK